MTNNPITKQNQKSKTPHQNQVHHKHSSIKEQIPTPKKNTNANSIRLNNLKNKPKSQ